MVVTALNNRIYFNTQFFSIMNIDENEWHLLCLIIIVSLQFPLVHSYRTRISGTQIPE